MRFWYRPLATPAKICVVVFAALAVFSLQGHADELELTNGRAYQGLVLEQTESSVRFRAVTDTGGHMTAEFPRSMIARLIVTGEEPQIEPPPRPEPPEPNDAPAWQPPAEADPPAEPQPQDPADDAARTPAEVRQWIADQGPQPPAWWDDVSADYPSSLDLAGTQANPNRQWRPNVDIGAYLVSTVNPNQARWRPAIKMLHEALRARRDDRDKLAEAMAMLGRAYLRYEADAARAAFWYEQALKRGHRPFAGQVVNLAECYWRLGSADLAAQTLARYGLDDQPFPAAIRLLGQMGRTAQALRLAERLAAGNNSADHGYLAAGHVYLTDGDFDRAAQAFQAVVDLQRGSRQLNRNKQRARNGLLAAQVAARLDLSGVDDGAYTGAARGYRANLNATVTIRGGRIDSIDIRNERDDWPFTSLSEVPARIVDAQQFNVACITEATTTSEAILAAVAQALQRAMQP